MQLPSMRLKREMEEITDKTFYDRARKKTPEGFGEINFILHSSTCQICTRPLYGPEHEEWHSRRHAAQLGLTE